MTMSFNLPVTITAVTLVLGSAPMVAVADDANKLGTAYLRRYPVKWQSSLSGAGYVGAQQR
jgi:hypothetical protein